MRNFFNKVSAILKIIGKTANLILNQILLGFAYFVGIGITSIFAKLFRKHFLDTKLQNRKTYWSSLSLKEKRIGEYYKQF